MSDGTVTAPTVEGYRFVCWVACVSVGWVGICYIEQPTNTTSKVWYITQRWNDGSRARCDQPNAFVSLPWHHQACRLR